jgi:hypothetical protein
MLAVVFGDLFYGCILDVDVAQQRGALYKKDWWPVLLSYIAPASMLS